MIVECLYRGFADVVVLYKINSRSKTCVLLWYYFEIMCFGYQGFGVLEIGLVFGFLENIAARSDGTTMRSMLLIVIQDRET